MKTIVYIDGFNFYYGSVKGTKYKWLNFQEFIKQTLPEHFSVKKIKYFTASVKGSERAKKQQTYLKALKTLKNFKIYKGNFLSNIKKVSVIPNGYSDQKARSDKNKKKWEKRKIIRTEEKGSDVNLASHLLFDAFTEEYDCVVIVTNDADFFMPLQIIKEYHKKHLCIISPHKKISAKLCKLTNNIYRVKKKKLFSSQFPDELTSRTGKKIIKPASW